MSDNLRKMFKTLEPSAEVSLGVVPNDEDGTFGVQAIFKNNGDEYSFWLPAEFAGSFGKAIIVDAREATEANRPGTLN